MITIRRILLLVAEFLFLRKCLPLVLFVGWQALPLLADNVRDLRIRKAWVLSNDVRLMVLTIKDESYGWSV